MFSYAVIKHYQIKELKEASPTISLLSTFISMKRRGNLHGIHLDEDTRLMLKVAGGDHVAYKELYRKYVPIVTDYIVNLDGQCDLPQNLAQEVFVRLWKNRAKYCPDSAAKTYLFGIARNVLSENQRCRYKQIKLHDHVKATCNSLDLQFNSREAIDLQELNDAIESAKSKLSDKQRQALELIFYSDISITEAARLAGCSDSAFRHRLFPFSRNGTG